MTLHQIKLFIAIAEEKSFSGGAKRLSVTQSTASQHIAALEDELSLQLFDRVQKGVRLTQGGKHLLPRARKVLLSFQGIYDAAAEINGLLATKLRIGCSNIPSLYLIPQLLPELDRSHPELQLTLIQAGSSDIIQSLLDEEIDLAVVGSCERSDQVEYRPFCSDELVLVAHRDHRWAKQQTIQQTTQQTTDSSALTSLADIASEPLLIREAGSGSTQAVLSATLKAGFDLRRESNYFVLGSNEAIKESILSGYGVAFLSALSVRREVERGDLVVIDVPGFTISRNLYLASRKGRELSGAGKIFCELLFRRYAGDAR